MPEPDLSPLARALGRLPSGLFIVTTELDGQPLGLLGSLVMQAGFEPPTVCVAIGTERDHLRAVRACGRFALSIIDDDSAGLMTPFFRRLEAGETPFDTLEVATTAAGSVVLSDALAWIDCSVVGEHATGDHVVFFGEVREARLLREGDPKIHLRKNGLSY